MADKKSGTTGKRSGRRKRLKRDLLYFYLNDKLYKLFHVNRPANIATCWDYAEKTWVKFAWSDLQKNAQRAYTTKEVALLVGRFWTIIERYVHNEEIPKPMKSYPIGGDQNWVKSAYRWSERDIMRLHDLMLTKHMGRPNSNGLGVPKAMPSKAELAAMMRNESITYIKDDSGEFQPVWKEINW